MDYITTTGELEAIYGKPGETSLVKETGHITDNYRRLIEASPFCALATIGTEGMDCSPRGDKRGFVRVADERTLMLPDRKGNNRTDSLKNIIRDPRVALLFLIPGHGNCLRINGEARLSVDPKLKSGFAVEGQEPRSVIVVKTSAVYFQCARAIVRAGLWDAKNHADPKDLPTPGEILAHLSGNRAGGKDYDREWSGRALKTLW